MSLSYDVLPVTLLTGFLGSGKSTLLADVLTGEAARDTAVLVNEFGEVGLDHLLMGEVDTQTVLLDNGCVCCSIRGELKEALADLFSRRARGEVPAFSRVVVETTGLATPAPLVATFLADPIVRSHYRLDLTVTTVDAVNAESQRARFPEWFAQITATDRIVITKIDLATEDQLATLVTALRKLNPLAEIIKRQASASSMSDTIFRPAGTQPRTLQSVFNAGAGSIRLGEGGGRLSHRVEEQRSINSHVIEFEEALDWQVFTLWFTMVINRYGDKLLRVKGILFVEGSHRPIVLHSVQHLVHPILHLDEWPDGKRTSTLVLISEGLDGVALEASFRRFHDRLTTDL